ncbi:MAG: hypothetical protein WKG01_40850 [Kofleriaceae bacterium]
MLARLRRLADVAALVLERLAQTRRAPPRRSRLERFGAIVQLTVPRALVFVDRAMARRTIAITGTLPCGRAPSPRSGTTCCPPRSKRTSS